MHDCFTVFNHMVHDRSRMSSSPFAAPPPPRSAALRAREGRARYTRPQLNARHAHPCTIWLNTVKQSCTRIWIAQARRPWVDVLIHQQSKCVAWMMGAPRHSLGLCMAGAVYWSLVHASSRNKRTTLDIHCVSSYTVYEGPQWIST